MTNAIRARFKSSNTCCMKDVLLDMFNKGARPQLEFSCTISFAIFGRSRGGFYGLSRANEVCRLIARHRRFARTVKMAYRTPEKKQRLLMESVVRISVNIERNYKNYYTIWLGRLNYLSYNRALQRVQPPPSTDGVASGKRVLNRRWVCAKYRLTT